MSAPFCTLTMREIVEITAQHFDVSVVDLISPRREARLLQARNAAAWVIRELLPRSYPEIGRVLGGRDHTTVMNACAAVEARMGTDPEYAAQVETVRNHCLGARSLGTPDVSPFEAAQRVLRSSREATGVSIETIHDFAAIVIAALQEATRQEAARAGELARSLAETDQPCAPQPCPPDPPRAPVNAEVQLLRAALNDAQRKIGRLESNSLEGIPHPLTRLLREWTDASIAAEAASDRGQRAANARVERVAQLLQAASEKHFNIMRKSK